MEKFTKVELSWVIGELESQAAMLKLGADNCDEEIGARFMNLRSEQYTSIASRLRNAVEHGNKRIEITY